MKSFFFTILWLLNVYYTNVTYWSIIVIMLLLDKLDKVRAAERYFYNKQRSYRSEKKLEKSQRLKHFFRKNVEYRRTFLLPRRFVFDFSRPSSSWNKNKNILNAKLSECVSFDENVRISFPLFVGGGGCMERVYVLRTTDARPAISYSAAATCRRLSHTRNTDRYRDPRG